MPGTCSPGAALGVADTVHGLPLGVVVGGAAVVPAAGAVGGVAGRQGGAGDTHPREVAGQVRPGYSMLCTGGGYHDHLLDTLVLLVCRTRPRVVTPRHLAVVHTLVHQAAPPGHIVSSYCTDSEYR